MVKRHDDAAPGEYHALETWQAHDGRLVDTIIDGGGGVREFDSTGWHDDTLLWNSAPSVQPAQEFVYTRLPNGAMRVDWKVARDGTHFVVGDTLSCTKG
jgi:hypothetical protein